MNETISLSRMPKLYFSHKEEYDESFLQSAKSASEFGGECVNSLESELCKKFNRKYAVATLTGTMALYLAYRCARILSYKNVLMPSWTHPACIDQALANGHDVFLNDIQTSDCSMKLENKFAKFDADIKRVFGILNKAQTRVAESFDNDGNRTLASKFLQQIYLSQLEYETNIGNPEVNQVSKFVKATIKAIDSNKTSFTELEADLLEKMLGNERYLDADGEFNSQKIYDTFNSAEKASIAAIQDVYKSLEEKASFTAAVIRGKRITPRNNYVHLNVIAQDGAQDLMTSPSEIQTYSNGMNPSTRGQSLTERTGTVSPLNFDVYASASRGAKFVLMDYHLTEPIRTARRTINATKKLLQGDKVRIDKNEREIINAIEEGFEEATMNLLTNSYMQTA